MLSHVHARRSVHGTRRRRVKSVARLAVVTAIYTVGNVTRDDQEDDETLV